MLKKAERKLADALIKAKGAFDPETILVIYAHESMTDKKAWDVTLKSQDGSGEWHEKDYTVFKNGSLKAASERHIRITGDKNDYDLINEALKEKLKA